MDTYIFGNASPHCIVWRKKEFILLCYTCNKSYTPFTLIFPLDDQNSTSQQICHPIKCRILIPENKISNH